MGSYTPSYYAAHSPGSRSSAKAILPVVLGLAPIRSVLDVGCGLGTWLATCRELGIVDLLGVDGSAVDPQRLELEAERFLRRDLNVPLRIGRNFDLVISMEVAEHLEASSAGTFVRSLVSHGDIILFSAAIPFQGGEHHVNERWQSYWAALFSESGFDAIDCVRPAVWDVDSVAPFYAQNTILYVRSESLDRYPTIKWIKSTSTRLPLDLVHPRMFIAAATSPLRLGLHHTIRQGVKRLRR